MPVPRLPAHLRWFRRLLRLLPAEFRGDFGDDMQADFADEYRAARRAGGGAAAVVWARTLPDLLRTALRQHADALAADTRFAVRLMARTPGFTMAALLMIALGTGANAAMFSVIDAILLRSSFPESAQLVLVRAQGSDGRITAAISLPHFRAIADSASPFSAVGAMGGGQRPVITGIGEAHRFNAECVTSGMFRALGTPAALGRTFTADEDRAGGPYALVVSDGFWRRELGSAPDAVGRVLALDGAPFTIVGVMPQRFGGAYSRGNTDGWLPEGPSIDGRPVPGCAVAGTLNVVARLEAGMTPEGATAAATDSSGIARLPDANGRSGARLSLVSLEEQTVDDLKTPLLALLGAVALVLLIACANVANLQLDRVYGRRAELAIRMALGATRARMVRQTIVESMVTFLAGGMAGVALAYWTLGAVVALLPAYVPHASDVELNDRVLAGTLAAALTAGVASGLVPALQGSQQVLVEAIRGARGSTRGGDWTRRIFVVAQIALSVVLVVGATLMIRTYSTLRPAAPGFASRDKITAAVRLRGSARAPAVVLTALADRVSRIPGVLSVAASTYVPMSGLVSTRQISNGGDSITVFSGAVTPNYFDDMSIPVLAGRSFTAADRAGAPPVAIANETLVRRLFGGVPPIGATLDVAESDNEHHDVQIVGVTRDTRCSGADVKACSEIYFPFAQAPSPALNLFVRTAAPRDPRIAAGIRDAMASVDPSQVVDRVEVLQDMLDTRVARPRFGAWLLGLFAGLALLLASVGLAASIAWWVAQRTREIGVRIALGAAPSRVTGGFVRQGLVLTAAGLATGLAGAAASTRLLESWLYGVTPLDPLTFAGSALVLLAIAALATYIPARRAARVDPLVALRAE